eukprot:6184372-Pleurochrysis_carterae.AAC.1
MRDTSACSCHVVFSKRLHSASPSHSSLVRVSSFPPVKPEHVALSRALSTRHRRSRAAAHAHAGQPDGPRIATRLALGSLPRQDALNAAASVSRASAAVFLGKGAVEWPGGACGMRWQHRDPTRAVTAYCRFQCRRVRFLLFTHLLLPSLCLQNCSLTQRSSIRWCQQWKKGMGGHAPVPKLRRRRRAIDGALGHSERAVGNVCFWRAADSAMGRRDLTDNYGGWDTRIRKHPWRRGATPGISHRPMLPFVVPRHDKTKSRHREIDLKHRAKIAGQCVKLCV